MLTRFRPARQTLLYKSMTPKSVLLMRAATQSSSSIGKIMLDREHDQFHSSGDTGLIENIAQVVLHCVFGNPEAFRQSPCSRVLRPRPK